MNKATETPICPGYLAAPTRRWWQSVVASYELEPHHVLVLSAAASAWDRLQQARKLIAVEGLTIKTRDGSKAHPAVQIERDARLAFLRALRELDLDVTPPAAASRPPALRSIAAR